MPHSSAHPLGAGRAPSGQPGRRPPLSPADRLDQLSARLDDLIRDVRFITARSHREADRRIAEAEDIAGGIRAVFRSATNPEHPPLKREGSGAWW
jgi:hypothetical protein